MADLGETHRLYTVDQLYDFSAAVFERSGMPSADAALLAQHLVWAELRGLSWLGMKKIPQHLGRLRSGATVAEAAAITVLDAPSLVVVDAHHTFAMISGNRLMARLIEKARAAGVAIGVMRNTTSAGALGFYASQAADAGMVGVAINNSTPIVAAPGGAAKILGNQAFAIGSPAGRHPPVILDMAISMMSLVRIHDYELRGEPLPEGIALDVAGEPTVDPVAALASEILLPMAGHRGFGLALMWEILTGVLAGGDIFGKAVRPPWALDEPQGISMLMIAIDPTRMMPLDDFKARVDRVVDDIHASPTRPGYDRIVVPGERSQALAARRRVEGMPVAPSLVNSLNEIGEPFGLHLPV